MASDKKGLIAVSPTGTLLGMLGASGALKDAIADFANTNAKKDGALARIMVPSFSVKPKYSFIGVDCGSEDVTVIAASITKQAVEDALAVLALRALKTEPLFGLQSTWDELGEEEESVVDIAFWYYGNTSLVYSIRRVSDNFFYDFATKRFSLLPVSPRAGMPRSANVPSTPRGYIYSTRLSGQLDDGEYVVTVRDSNADDVVIGIMALFMHDGVQKQTPPQGLDNTPIEEGIPTPVGTLRCPERRVRSVDT